MRFPCLTATFAFLVVSSGGCGSPPTDNQNPGQVGSTSESEVVALTMLRATANGIESKQVEVPRSYINTLLAERTKVARREKPSADLAQRGVSIGSLQQGLVSSDAWVCSSNDMWMADAGWSHYICANWDGISSTGTCGNLDGWVRYYGIYPSVYHWGGAVAYFWPGSWDACWTATHSCTGTSETALAFASGGTTDPNGSGTNWTTADSTVQAAHGIFAGTCPQ